jgi:hypothetical protein
MTIYYTDKQSTQEVKKFLKPHTMNKISEPKQEYQKTEKKTLPIRGNPSKK